MSSPSVMILAKPKSAILMLVSSFLSRRSTFSGLRSR